MYPMASRKKLPMMTIATAAATPAIDSPVRKGLRSMLRRIMCRLVGMPVRPNRSNSVRR